MRNTWFNWFFYGSIFFLLYSLYQADYLFIPKIYHPLYISISLIILCLGFIVNVLSWHFALKAANYDVSIGCSTASIGLTIFGKYIPGKIWAIVGRSEYISQMFGFPGNRLANLSLSLQLVTLWVGINLGCLGLVVVGGGGEFWISLLLIWILLSVFIFTDIAHRLIKYFIFKIMEKEVEIPKLSFLKTLSILPFVFLNWGLWCIAFQLMAQGLTNVVIPASVGFGFALAGTLGILAIIAPGGIGVREGFLAGYLILAGLPNDMAVLISVSSRLWFLVGEGFIFILGFVMDRKIRRNAIVN